VERNGFTYGGALSVTIAFAAEELNAALRRLRQRGLRTVVEPFTEAAFKAALRDAGIAFA
jgi:hypothetical protein